MLNITQFEHFDLHLWTFEQKYGWRVFYRGSWIILVRSLPANAATFIGWLHSNHHQIKTVIFQTNINSRIPICAKKVSVFQ